jgi:hypothetical protein
MPAQPGAHQDPFGCGAILISAAARVLAVEVLPPVRIADPTDPAVVIEDGPGFRIELDMPDRGATLLMGFGLVLPTRRAADVTASTGLALLREWCDLDVELEAYELPWHAVRVPVASMSGGTVSWSASRLVTRLVDPLRRSVDLPARRSLDQLLPDWTDAGE